MESRHPENNEKTRQNAENKQTLDLTRKIEFKPRGEKLVKTLKINKLDLTGKNTKNISHVDLLLLLYCQN